MPFLYDAHCHLDFPDFDGRRELVIERCRQAGVERLVMAGVRRPDWERLVRTAATSSHLYYCLGIHPWWAREHGEADIRALEDRLRSADSRCLGVGECGLDALHGPLEEQEPMFVGQLRLAMRLNVPLVIHSVKTHDRVAAALRRERFQGRALVHGFSGSYQQAMALIGQGCFLGIGGVITHERARKTRDVVRRLPLSAMVLETDAPDMPPSGVAPGRNSPENIPQVFQSLVELRRETPDELRNSLWENAGRLFGW